MVWSEQEQRYVPGGDALWGPRAEESRLQALRGVALGEGIQAVTGTCQSVDCSQMTSLFQLNLFMTCLFLLLYQHCSLASALISPC